MSQMVAPFSQHFQGWVFFLHVKPINRYSFLHQTKGMHLGTFVFVCVGVGGVKLVIF